MKETDIKWGDIYFDAYCGSYFKAIVGILGGDYVAYLVDLEEIGAGVVSFSTMEQLLEYLAPLTHVGTITSFAVSKTISKNINLKQ